MSSAAARDPLIGPDSCHSDADCSRHSKAPGTYFRWKSFAIRLFAAFLLFLASPVIAFLAVLIRLTSNGPAIYRQVRVGKNGKPFLMYKLRTMTLDAESETGPAWSTNEDPRLTRLGKWIRVHHLDELPQLINVVLGQMDIFGPRPERPEFVRVLRHTIPDYERRMDVLPGITGLAQNALPPDTDLGCVRRKLRMDLEYIQNACLSLDSRTFACAVLRLGGFRDRLAMRISRLAKAVDPVMLEIGTSSAGHGFRGPMTLHQLRESTAGSSTKARLSGPRRFSVVHKPQPATQRTNDNTAEDRWDEKSEVLNAFTIDVEDYFQVTGFEGSIDRDSWDGFESRVVQNTRRLLRILDRHSVKATFFVLGWVAEKFPRIVKEIHDQGHEIGSHSYWHRLIYELTPDQFREDLRRSRDILEGLVQQRITLFRAPSFSITEKSEWALDILLEEGFTIDSSIFPVHHDRYGMPDAPTHVHEIERDQGSLWEFPPSILPILGTNLPIAGGGYFRFFPLELTAYAVQRVNKAGDPFLFYVHPWELDPDQPRLSVGSRLSRFRHYVNLASVESRLDNLLELFPFGCLSDTLSARQARTNPSLPKGIQRFQPSRPR